MTAYEKFLTSDFWKELSQRKKREIGECENCGARRNLEAHHIRYPADWYETKMTDLRVLCHGCHSLEHGIEESRGRWVDDLDTDQFFEWCHSEQHRVARGWKLAKRSKKKIRRMLDRYPEEPAVIFQGMLVLKIGSLLGGWR